MGGLYNYEISFPVSPVAEPSALGQEYLTTYYSYCLCTQVYTNHIHTTLKAISPDLHENGNNNGNTGKYMSILGILRILRILGILRIRRIRRIMYIPSTKHQAQRTYLTWVVCGTTTRFISASELCVISVVHCRALPFRKIYRFISASGERGLTGLSDCQGCLSACQTAKLPDYLSASGTTCTPVHQAAAATQKNGNRRRMHACTHRVTICHVYHTHSLSLSIHPYTFSSIVLCVCVCVYFFYPLGPCLISLLYPQASLQHRGVVSGNKAQPQPCALVIFVWQMNERRDHHLQKGGVLRYPISRPPGLLGPSFIWSLA